jgi:hypothetical protein
MSTFPEQRWSRARRFVLGLLLLSLPACGLSDYEAQMQKTQERLERFQDERTYLDAPVSIPTEKDKDDHDVPLANVFFRPPKGINSKPVPQPRLGLMWRYEAGKRSEFEVVEMAFADSDSEFAQKVVNSYGALSRDSTTERQQPLPFDSWEFKNSDYGYSINIYKGGAKQIAVVYIFKRDRRDKLRKAIDLSLESLTEKVSAARQRYNQKSPWMLEKRSGS